MDAGPVFPFELVPNFKKLKSTREATTNPFSNSSICFLLSKETKTLASPPQGVSHLRRPSQSGAPIFVSSVSCKEEPLLALSLRFLLSTSSSRPSKGPKSPAEEAHIGPKGTTRVKKKERDEKESSRLDEKKKKKEEEVLTAGYLAHKYLMKGTLLRRMWDPQRHENCYNYVKLAQLLKIGRAHFSGVVNPAQLICYLRPSPPPSSSKLEL
ncbi:hypothetical protein Ahy_B06g081822 [Arachis hypogaea]|uniref:Uncharacterized protein n=1 Tax=Arachis hypogaea TaxID=3818 RepID=A0A444YM37_ARAHY|nr:hypothetical protein Ahy_B06g081822 [Arachis hypogaea]